MFLIVTAALRAPCHLAVLDGVGLGVAIWQFAPRDLNPLQVLVPKLLLLLLWGRLLLLPGLLHTSTPALLVDTGAGCMPVVVAMQTFVRPADAPVLCIYLLKAFVNRTGQPCCCHCC